MAQITLKGTPFNTNGDLPKVGSGVPLFSLVSPELKDVSLEDYRGREKLLSIVPSLDTPTCALSTKHLNDIARDNPELAVLIISADLPFAMQRFCVAEHLENIQVLSMMRSRQFAEDYGVLILDGPLAGIAARALILLDKNDVVLHSQLVSEIAEEPDYQAALVCL